MALQCYNGTWNTIGGQCSSVDYQGDAGSFPEYTYDGNWITGTIQYGGNWYQPSASYSTCGFWESAIYNSTFIDVEYIGYTEGGPTNDGTPTIEFTLDEDADCRLSDEQLNYTDMNVTMDCSTTGGTSQECTMYKTLSNGIIPLYLACNDSAGNMQDYVLSDPAYTFNISINNPPVITLNKPDDNITKYVADILITFNFTVTDDASPTLNCSLYINNILNQTNSSVLNNNLTNFLPIYLSRGTWIWNVTCIENVGDLLEDTEIRTLYVNNTLPTWLHNISNVSINRTSGTTVYLTNLTDYVTDADNDIIYFTVENENVSEVDCNIVGNTNLTLSPYDFWYGNASCIIGINESYGYGYGENRTVNVEVLSVDTIKPIIYLINPTNNSRTVGTYTELRFNVSDSSIITNCTLYINGTLNQTDTSITKDISQSFYIYTGESNSYSWNISCLDYYNNSNTTQYNIFRVNTPSSTSSLVSPENASYVGGDTNLLDWNASTDNESDSISYYVWYSMTNPPSYSFYTTSTSSYVDTSTSGTYYWYIKSYDGYEFSDSSDIFRFTTSLDVPTVTRISPESNLLTDDSSILFNVSVTDDNLDTSETKLNLGGTWYNLIDYIVSGSTYYFWRTITGLTEQNYSYYFTARNNLGVLGSSSTDYAAVNYSAYINIPYTGSIGPYGSIYWKPATGYNITYVAPDGMSATNYTFSMTNNDDTRNGTVLIKVDSNYTTYKLCCNDIYDNSSCIGIDDNYISINNSLYAGDTCYVWCWMNYTNPTSVWNGNIYVNMKGV